MRPLPLIAALVTVLAGCSATPTAPSGAANNSSPPPASAKRLTGVVVNGPDRIAPGQTAQFTATLNYSDGTTTDVTPDAGWESTRPDIVAISATGSATASSAIPFPAVDDGQVVAYLATQTFYDGLFSASGAKSTLVIPAGTYRLNGSVNDGGAPARSFVVQIISGIGAGTAIERCDIQGKCGGFVFYGVAGPTEIRITKAGYQPVVKSIDVRADSNIEFDLISNTPRDDVSGRWTLTATASDECSAVLPPELRTRRYSAIITQNQALLDVVLEGATFVTASGSGRPTFDGHVDRDGVTFRITRATIDEYGTIQVLWKVLEQLSPTSFVAVGGYVDGRVSPAGISAMMDGEFAMVSKVGANYVKGVSCLASTHRVVLTR